MAAFIAIYYSVAKAGMSLALPIPPSNVTPVWLPSPIAWTALLWFGYRFVPAVWLADFIVSSPGYYEASQSWPTAIAVGSIIAVGATLEATVGNLLLRRLIGKGYPFGRANDTFKFVLIALLSAACNSLIGVTTLCLFRISNWADFDSVWLTWWIGNAITLVILMPMLLAWRRIVQFRPRPQQFTEIGLFFLTLFGIGKLAFGFGFPVEYLLIPCLIWAAFRFGQIGATTGIVLVTGVAIWGTVQGRGSFIRDDLNESLLLLQTFMGAIAVTTLMMMAVLEERRQSKRELELANEQLALQVQERTHVLNALQLANEQLQVEVTERKQTEETLRQSEAQLRDQTQRLEETLLDLTQTQTQLIQTEKLSSLGQLLAGVAHEINNPINFIAGNLMHVQDYTANLLQFAELCLQQETQASNMIQAEAEAIELDFLAEDMPKMLDSMKMGTERIQQIVLSLRNFSRVDGGAMQVVDIHEGIDSTLLILQHRLKANSERPAIRVVKQYSNLPTVECFIGQLNQVFMNILANSIDALDHNPGEQTNQPTITITTERLQNGHVLIRLADNGPGMSEECLTKLFDAFYTTKPMGKGTGLGLSISHQIVTEKHGGSITCVSELGNGAEFRIELPVLHASRQSIKAA
ncbi:MASE1 domain-containing protein [Leptolyngbya sp. AN02str]|uniref:MASE1 domain-containing protein n=1 Tax=Leptolyngbya sp. AN02str TaxID=3423363 RepID=UPI003D31DDFF